MPVESIKVAFSGSFIVVNVPLEIWILKGGQKKESRHQKSVVDLFSGRQDDLLISSASGSDRSFGSNVFQRAVR